MMTKQCTEGDHKDCPGTWHSDSTGGDMTCACGHHYVPPSHGEVPVPEHEKEALSAQEYTDLAVTTEVPTIEELAEASF